MKIITLHQPWASFIAWGWKTIETRTHKRFNCLLSETIGIHAGKHWDKQWLPAAYGYLSINQIREISALHTFGDVPFGQIICTARVYQVTELNGMYSSRALIDCNANERRHGLFLYEIKKLVKPIEAKGHQGIWNYPVEEFYEK